MTAVALRGLAGRKLRSSLTALAIVLGVAMISGTYILTDTIDKGFSTIFNRSYENSDAVITGKVAFTNSQSNTLTTPAFPESVLAKVRALPDVDAAVGAVQDQAKLIGHNGKVISVGGAPNLGFSHDSKADERFNPLRLDQGTWPVGSTQIAIDKNTAKNKDFSVGDTIGVATTEGVREFTISGTATFAGASIGGATLAIFDLPTAQRLFDKIGKLDAIRVAAKSGVSTEKLIAQIKPLLPPTAQVRSGTAQAKEDSKDVTGFLSFLQKFLLAFGGVALFVGSFVIANTLSITIAQRVREFATLRTIGASRKQVLGSVILEALVVGVIASVVGLFLGLGLAKGLNSLFVSFGIDLPQSGTVFATRTIVVSLAVGIAITLVASLRPALRATRVPPIAAAREGAVLPQSRFARFGPIPGLITLAVGIALFLVGLFDDGLATGPRIISIVVGCLLLFFGVAQNARRVVRPLASVLGLPAARLAGSAGALARDNAMRNPSRTASTAAALMIGIALVTFVAVLGQGLRSTFEDAVNKQFIADYALTSQNGFDPITIEAEAAAERAPSAEVVSGVRAGDGRAFGKTIQVTGVEPNLSKVIHSDWVEGSPAVPAQLGTNGAFVEQDYAKHHDLAVGSPIHLETPYGKVLDLRLKGIFNAPKGGSPFGSVTMSAKRFDAEYPAPKNLFAFINASGGVTPTNTSQLELALNSYPDAKIQTQQQFKDNQEKGLNTILNLLYVLLALSVIVSLFGIVNTLVLTVFERTRELGMLRAIGMTRRQVRRMIRQESVVTALIGATLGIVVGLFLAALVTKAFESDGLSFAVPVGTIIVFAIAAVIAGILAAIFPARRAARLNVLEALQYE